MEGQETDYKGEGKPKLGKRILDRRRSREIGDASTKRLEEVYADSKKREIINACSIVGDDALEIPLGRFSASRKQGSLST